MSGIVVFIGYILIIPSVMGICLGGMAMLGLGGAAATSPESSDQVASALGIIIANATLLVFMGASLLFGLLGWLLVMKKSVLQCDSCGAVVPAS